MKNNPFWPENVARFVKHMHGMAILLRFSTSAPRESKSWWWSKDLQAVIKNLLLIMSFYFYTSYPLHILNHVFLNHLSLKTCLKQNRTNFKIQFMCLEATSFFFFFLRNQNYSVCMVVDKTSNHHTFCKKKSNFV